MTTRNATALCQATDLPAGHDGQAPDWVHLLPAGAVRTVDGRGPYIVSDAAGLARDSLQASGGRLLIDEAHSTDLAAPNGLPAPARGWVTDLEARADGVWGKVEWTESGKKLVIDRAYRGLSPVITHLEDGRVTSIKRASLVNNPNLRGLTTLHSEENMDLLAKLRELLGLAADADEAAVIAAITKAKKDGDDKGGATALQAQLAPIVKALGLQDGADQTAVLQSIATIKTGPNEAVTALQAELNTVTTRFNTLQSSIGTQTATAFVDNAIKAGRVGVKPLRDHYIAMHAENSARVEKEINAMPILGPSGAQITPPTDKDGQISLNAEQLTAAKLLGVEPEAYRKTLQAEQPSSS